MWMGTLLIHNYAPFLSLKDEVVKHIVSSLHSWEEVDKGYRGQQKGT